MDFERNKNIMMDARVRSLEKQIKALEEQVQELIRIQESLEKSYFLLAICFVIHLLVRLAR